MIYSYRMPVAITKVSVNEPDSPDNYFFFIGEKRYVLLEMIKALSPEERAHLFRVLYAVEEEERSNDYRDAGPRDAA